MEKAKKKEERGRVERQVGRLLQRNSRSAALFQVQVTDSQRNRCGLEVTWKRDEKASEWAALSEGCYILRASQLDWTAEQYWQAYVQLTDVEEAFRIHKTELRIRPVFHQKADRTRAHIFICFMAYVMWKTLEQWSQRSGLGKSPRKLIEEFQKIQSADVILPTTDNRKIILRCIVRPEAAQALLIDRLGLEIPKRLRPPKCLDLEM